MTTNTAKQDITLTAAYQRAVGQLVSREVHYCVSQLIGHLASDCENEHYEDILSVCVQDDWKEAAANHLYDLDCDDCVQVLESIDIYPCDDETVDELRQIIYDRIGCGDIDAQELCESLNLDPYQREAFEHWIVSDWLADKLEAAGEMVCKDIHGLTIWGRCTTGQSISIDGVMCGIYNDMGATWHLDEA